ncbi:MAG: hypothetical protein UHO11_07355 [Treponema sp.]|nr:hypothetical protein [Treponema sp.]
MLSLVSQAKKLRSRGFFFNEKEKIKINVANIDRQLKSEMYSSEASWTDKVDYVVSNFTDRCRKVVAKLHHAISCFKNFLQGRTASEFR